MAISQRAAGTWASHGTTQNVQVPFPTGYTPIVGDLAIVVGSWKAFGTTATVDQGWSEILDVTGGSTAAGNGTGSVRLYVAYKVLKSTAEVAPTISRSAAPAPGAGVMVVFQKAATEAWDVAALSAATEQAMGSTAMSHVCTTTAAIASGDLVFALTGVGDNSGTFTRATTAISGGPTWSGNVVEYPSSHLSTTDSNDMAADLVYRVASSAVASGQSITVTATLSAAERVGSVLFRVRVKAATATAVAEVSLAPGSTPSERTHHTLHARARVTSGVGTLRMALYEGANNRSGDLETSLLTTSLADYTLPIADASAANITDYSNLSIRFWGYDAFAGAATVFEVDQVWLEAPVAAGVSASVVVTGGGVLTPSSVTVRTRTQAVTGGGILTPSSVTTRASAQAMTGGGVATIAAAPIRAATVTATGGGVATASVAKVGRLTYVATGGGILTPESVTTRTRADVSTGGGVATIDAPTTRPAAVTITGGGVLAPDSPTIRPATVAATGGGVATVDGEAVVPEDIRSADVVATGGGVATTATAKRGDLTDVATGGGVLTQVASSLRTATIAATGAGIATVAPASVHAATVAATGSGVATAVGSKHAALSLAATGAGTATTLQTTTRTASVGMTGGGVASVDGENPDSGVHTASIEATGGGVASVTATKWAYLALATTGGGTATPSAGTIRTATPSATGAGTIPIDAETWRLASVLVTGGGVATVHGREFFDWLHAHGSVSLSTTATARVALSEPAAALVTISSILDGTATLDVEPSGVVTADPELAGVVS